MALRFDVNTDRMVEEFKQMTAIDSLSGQERDFADVLIKKLEALGCTVEEDDAGDRIGGNCGNIFARFPGYPEGSQVADKKPILLAAHMDTVVPGIGKEAIVQENGTIAGNGKTVLGADDVVAVVEILEGLRILKEQKLSHRPLELLFTVSEETYALGGAAFDIDKLEARDVYALDLTGPIGTAAVKAPSLIWFKLVIHGKPSHAGFEPEKGINAVQIAAKAITRMQQGHIDEDTTYNIGTIKGGTRTNIVSDRCEITGETRSFDHEKATEMVRRTEQVFAGEAEAAGATCEVESKVLIRAYDQKEDTEVCRRFVRALTLIDALPVGGKIFTSTLGGSDNNSFAEKGLAGIVPACGMYNPHSVHEYTKIEDLRKGAELVAALSIV